MLCTQELHNIIQIQYSLLWDWQYPQNTPGCSLHLNKNVGNIQEYFVEYYQSHRTLLWIWTMFCYLWILFVLNSAMISIFLVRFFIVWACHWKVIVTCMWKNTLRLCLLSLEANAYMFIYIFLFIKFLENNNSIIENDITYNDISLNPILMKY